MPTCARCGQDNPDGNRFCGNCGAPLAAASAAREERKVVSVLFADLVGFTSRSERLDPEDVRAMLSPYFARVREEIERHGGTVEKFIGDAVMALFGAPVTHEDDPERAVRAALAIRDAIRQLNELEPALELQLRQAVTTGEALIALDARPSAGEGMASGDVVNTASRLQTAAPVNGILVNQTTYRATRHSIEYREAEYVDAKGKVDPVPAWEAVAARSRFGVDIEAQAGTPLVGRERELASLTDALARARRETSCQLVTLVGVPGIGKSRLVAELFRVIDRDDELIYWRQGRSLPYGESMSFWALGEIAKAQAGILESDSTEEAAAKLRSALEDPIPDESERDWVERHLRPLVGLSVEVDAGSDRRGEAFTAWRRFFEGIAERSPLVLVFEDLHWADDGLLDFVDHLAEWVTGVPVLIVCTARPELLDRRPGWGGGKLNSFTASIPALTPEETTRLVAGLLEQTLLPAEVQTALLERAEGNPLYAEEYVRMLQDRGFLVRGPSGWRLEHAEELALPESVQGMIAARLDALTAPQKELILDAAVVGKVFWPAVLAAIGGRPAAELEDDLHALARKEFVRRERRSAIDGETQYAFLHLLVRDVAYGQIPRAARVEKHHRAACWIDSLAPDRSEDRAEMLAHHYLEALSLADAAGVDAEALRAPARAALVEATERSHALNAFSTTVRYASAALDLGHLDPLEEAHLKLRRGQAQWYIGELDFAAVREAREAFLAHGELERAADASVVAADAHTYRGETREAIEELDRAATFLADRPISLSKARVFAVKAREAALLTDPGAIEYAEQAVAMADELGSDELASHALNTRALIKVDAGDESAIEDGERSAELARAAKLPDHVHRALNNLANICWTFGRLDDAERYHAEARAEAERFGSTQGLRWLEGEAVTEAEFRGRWDEALARSEIVLAQAAESRFYMESPARIARARIFVARGDVEAALAESERGLEIGREARHPQALGPGLLWRARALAEAGRTEEAEPLVSELLDLDQGTMFMADVPLLLAALGRESDYPRARGRKIPSPWLDAGDRIAERHFSGAARLYDEIGVPPLAADARLLAAEALLAEGRRAEADAELQRALAFYRKVRATAYLKRGEALLAASA
jgi:class 3 adenylate cyclase